MNESSISIENFADFHQIKFVKRSHLLFLFYHLFGVLTLGLLHLAFYWFDLHHLLFTETEVYISATHVIIYVNNGKIIISKIEEDTFVLNPLDESVRSKKRFFYFAKSKYVFDERNAHFSKLETRFARSLEDREVFDLDVEVGKLGVNWANVLELQKTFGKNEFFFEKVSTWWLILEGIINPLSITIFLFSILCYLAYKMVHAVTYLVYVLLIIVFHVLEVKGKEARIEELSLNETEVKVFRRSEHAGKIPNL